MYNTPSEEPFSRVDYNRLHEKVGMLESQVQRLNELLVQQNQDIDYLSKRIPNTWLLDKNYLKRAFTVYAYTLVAGLIIGIPIYCIIFIISMLTVGTGNY